MPRAKKEQIQDTATRQAVALTFAFLRRRGIGQNTVARRLDIGPQLISMVKTGKRSPSIRHVEMLWELAQAELTKGPPLDQDELLLVGKAAVAWWKAIEAQTAATLDLKKAVARKLEMLEAAPQPTADDLKQLAACASESLKLGAWLQQLAALGTAWQDVGRKFYATWERVSAERYPGGPPRNIIRTSPGAACMKGQSDDDASYVSMSLS